jgi:ParB family transcriptional regulator, chromosome partitioning protein
MANNPTKGWGAVRHASQSLAAQDATTRAESDRSRTEPGSIDIGLVRPRPTDTRKLDPRHVVDLVESIAALGLLEPLVVDRKHRLLAGGHRLAAMRLLVEPDPEKRAKAWATIAQLAWALDDAAPLPKDAQAAIERLKAIEALPDRLVPVRIVDVDGDKDEEKALAIEIAENEKRRDYTKLEVVALSERLKSAGFRMARGKPKAGERALGPALAVIIGKSERQVRRILGGDDIRTDVLISPKPVPQVLGRLQTAITALQNAATGPQKRRLADVLAAAEKLSAAISALDDA